MSVQTELTRISTAKTNIKNVVNSNTANTITNQKLDAFPPLINGTIAAQKGYIPWIKGEGSNFTLKNSKSGELGEFEIYGNTEQTTYTGIQCIKKDGLSTPKTDTDFWANITSDFVTLEDGWGRIVFDNSSGSSNKWINFFIKKANVNLKTNTQYTVITEFRNIGSDNQQASIVLGQARSDEAIVENFYAPISSTPSKTLVTTKSDFTNVAYGLRGFSSTAAGKKSSFEFRISILEGDYTSTNYTYEPYVGGAPSPNPDYPQDIKVVKGNSAIKATGKSLFNYNIINVSTIAIDNDGTLLISGISTANGYCDTQKTLSQLCPNLQVGDTAYLYLNTDFYENGDLKNYIYIGEKWKNGKSKEITQAMLDAYVIVYGGYQTTSHLKIMITKTLDTTYEPYQGQAYPIALHGKNLFDEEYEIGGYNINTGIKETNNAMYRSVNSIPVKPNTQYQFSIDGTTISETPRYFFYDINKNKLSSTVTSGSFTTPDNCYYLTWHSSMLKTDYPNGLSKTQIEEGSAATAYEPYYNYELCKIGNYKDEIKKSTGKNLLNSEIEEGAYYPATGVKKEESGAYRNATPILVKPNTNYRFSIKGTGYAINVYEYDKDNNYIGYLNNIAVTANSSFTTSQNTKYINIHRGSSGGNQQWQLEENPTVTEYEPAGKVWYLKSKIEKTILNGSEDEDWTLSPVSNLNRYIYPLEDPIFSTKCISNYFKGVSYGTNQDYCCYVGTTGKLALFYNSITTAEAFKTWLSNNPITVYYVLATPIITEITNETLINQLNAIETFEGINNISIENENNVLPDLLMITKNKDSYNNWKTKEGLN